MQETADLVTFTEEILNGKLHFLCSDRIISGPLMSAKVTLKVSIVNPFSTSTLLLYPLKTSENLRFSDVFRGYRRGTLIENG